MENITLFWFRRDLRLEDNTGLAAACREKKNVLPLFIFDRHILDELEERSDARVQFIHEQVAALREAFQAKGGSMEVHYGHPEKVFPELLKRYRVEAVYTNRDYEPYARSRDAQIEELLEEADIPFRTFKDQVILEEGEVLNGSGEFYKVFTPYSKAWRAKFEELQLEAQKLEEDAFFQTEPLPFPSLEDMDFKPSSIRIPPMEVDEAIVKKYGAVRNFPAKKGTTRIGIHLRFGTISIRQLAKRAQELNDTYLNELIWREFYMMILAHNPKVVDQAFKPAYDQIPWRQEEADFEKWCQGKTGYPIVDAGMRELNATGYMHNRVRMIVASFLTKHLLIDWRWGEAYFAKKLLDYELSSNNGGWQWAAGTGTDAQPYFRVFNPTAQAEKFDKEGAYIKKWVPEYGTAQYPKPMVDHKFARERAIQTYKEALG
ncbi:MAG: cryptochrome/photolyase family protein [Nitritalea sp.]